MEGCEKRDKMRLYHESLDVAMPFGVCILASGTQSQEVLSKLSCQIGQARPWDVRCTSAVLGTASQ
jgi:hypothetical protein